MVIPMVGNLMTVCLQEFEFIDLALIKRGET